MIRRKIKPDNRCLFTAIGYAMEGRMDLAQQLRELSAAVIASDPVKYNEESLTMPNAAYVEYIMKPNTWGSANEIDILAEYYKICITVLRIKTMELESFGQLHPQQIFLLYNETHYDLAVKNESPGQEYQAVK